MPGIVEEVLFSLERRQPLYLAGGFGGATLDIIRTLRPDDAEWFPNQSIGEESDESAEQGLKRVSETASAECWDGYENGLTEPENRLLAASYRPNEIAALVGRGMANLSSPGNSHRKKIE